MDRSAMNLICNGTTSSGQDLAEVSSSPQFIKQLDTPGTLTLDSSTYPTVTDNVTIWCVFWNAWSFYADKPNGCLRDARAGLPQSYFPKTLSPSSYKVTLLVTNPNLGLKIINAKLEKDVSGNAIISFNLTNTDLNNISVSKIKITNKDVQYYYDTITPFSLDNIESGKTVKVVLKMKSKFCSLINLKHLELSVRYHGNPEIICHGKRIYKTVSSSLIVPAYPANDLKVGVVNSNIPIVDVLNVGSSFTVYNNKLIDEVNNYLKKCTTPECTVPINISISNDAYLILSDLKVGYSSCLLTRELLAHIISCWERGNYGKDDKDFMCYQIVVPQECTGTQITPDIISNILKNQELCNVVGMKDSGCGKSNDLKINLNRVLKEGDNILIEYRDNKVIVS